MVVLLRRNGNGPSANVENECNMQMTYTAKGRTVTLPELPVAKAETLAALPEWLRYLVDYGWKQSLSDSYAGAEDADDAEGRLLKRMDKILAGDMSVRDGGTRTTDPVEKEYKRLRAIQETAWAARRKAEKKPKASAELVALWRERFDVMFGEETRATAEANVEASNALEIDFDDLLDGVDETPDEPTDESAEETVTE